VRGASLVPGSQRNFQPARAVTSTDDEQNVSLRRATMAKRIVRVRQHPATEFANQSEVNEADAPALGSASGREEGRSEDEPLSDFEAEVLDHEGTKRGREVEFSLPFRAWAKPANLDLRGDSKIEILGSRACKLIVR
jgi:hypothetical protein